MAASKRLPAPRGAGRTRGGLTLAFDQTNVTRTRSLGAVFRRELHTLSLTQQLKHCAAHCTAMKEVFNSALIANESEPLVDEESSDSSGRHGRILRCAQARDKIPGASWTAGERTMKPQQT